MKKNNRFSKLILYSFLFFVFSTSVLAQESSDRSNSDKNGQDEQKNGTGESVINLGKSRQVAAVDVGEIAVEDKGNNNFSVSFSLINQVDIQPGVRYAIGLSQKNGEKETIVDRKAYDETIDFGSGEKIERTVVYHCPEYLSGNFSLFLESENSEGLRLVYMPIKEISLSGVGPKISLEKDICLIFFGEKQFNLENAYSFSREEIQSPSLRCKIRNISKEKETGAYLKADIYEKSYLGNISMIKKSDESDLVWGEEKNLKIDLKEAIAIRSPRMKIAVFSQSGEQVSASIEYPFLAGEPSLFYNIRLDKDYYIKEETARIIVDVRPAYPEGTTLSYNLTEENGLSCIEGKKEGIAIAQKSTTELSGKIIRNCFNPALSVLITDKSGKILDESRYSIKSRSDEAAKAKEKTARLFGGLGKTQWIILSALMLVILGRLIFWGYNRFRYKNYNLLLLFFLLASGFFTFSRSANAGTYVYDDIVSTGMGSQFTVVLNNNVPAHEGNTSFYIPDDNSLNYSASVSRSVFGSTAYTPAMLAAVTKHYDVVVRVYAEADADHIADLFNETANDRYVINSGMNMNWSEYTSTNYQSVSGSLSLPRTGVRGCDSHSPGAYDPAYAYWHVDITDAVDDTFSNGGGKFYIKERAQCASNPIAYSVACNSGCNESNPGNFDESQCSATGKVTWTCKANGLGSDASCSINTTQAVCGSAAGVSTAAKPETNLCVSPASVVSDPAISGANWVWRCAVNPSQFCGVGCVAPVLGSLCAGTVPANATVCPGDGVAPPLSSHQTWWNTGPACGTGFNETCEFQCNAGYYPDPDDPNLCSLPKCYSGSYISYTNTEFCAGSDLGLSAMTAYTLANTCTGAKCQYRCINGTVADYWSYWRCIPYATCGSSAGGSYSEAPTSGLCSTGNPSSVTTSGNQFKWSCYRAHIYASVDCYATKITVASPACGIAASSEHCTQPNADLCSGTVTATPTVSLSGNKFIWTCENGVGSTSCSAIKKCDPDNIWKETAPN